jgi:hypothetical protein
LEESAPPASLAGGPQIAEDRRSRLAADAVKAAQPREQRLERKAQSKMKTLS